MMKNYPELMVLLKAVATEDVWGSISALAERLDISMDLLVQESIPRVEFMIKNLTQFLKQIKKIEHEVVLKPLKMK